MCWSFRTVVNKTLPRMTPEQALRVRRLVRRLCANYDAGNCLPLDSPCPQLITSSLLCKYFRAAVLPADLALSAAILRERITRRCRLCGAPVFSNSNAANIVRPAPLRSAGGGTCCGRSSRPDHPQIGPLNPLRRKGFKGQDRASTILYIPTPEIAFDLRKSAPRVMRGDIF